MDNFRLNVEEQQHLVKTLRYTHDVRLYRRTLAVLECGRGKGIVEVAQALSVTRQSVSNWVSRYCRTREIIELTDAPKCGRPRIGGDTLDTLVAELMTVPPEQLGYQSSRWTVPLLRDQVQQNLGRMCSDAVVRYSLRRLGFRWKGSRFMLASHSQAGKGQSSVRNNGFVSADASLTC